MALAWLPMVWIRITPSGLLSMAWQKMKGMWKREGPALIQSLIDLLRPKKMNVKIYWFLFACLPAILATAPSEWNLYSWYWGNLLRLPPYLLLTSELRYRASI